MVWGRQNSLKKDLQNELSYCSKMCEESNQNKKETKSYLNALTDRLASLSSVGHTKAGPAKSMVKTFKETLSSGLGWCMVGKKPTKSEEDAPSPQQVVEWVKTQLATITAAEIEHVHLMQANTDVIRDELDDLSLACDRLWHLDSQRLEPGKHYKIDVQKGKNHWLAGDFAERPLFAWVDQHALQERATYRCFMALLDNYFAETGMSEKVTLEEIRENEAFLNACMETAPIKYLYNYLREKKLVTSTSSFKVLLDNLWFKLYRREVTNDSSGFEHVFVGEVREGQVIGMHSWLQLYNEENKGHLDYMGYIKPKRRGNNPLKEPIETERILTSQFKWKGKLKPISTSFIGTSPEFELALYTLCFMCGGEENLVDMGPYTVIVRCHRIARDKIGSSHPEEVPLSTGEAATKIQNRFRTNQVRKQFQGRRRR